LPSSTYECFILPLSATGCRPCQPPSGGIRWSAARRVRAPRRQFAVRSRSTEPAAELAFAREELDRALLEGDRDAEQVGRVLRLRSMPAKIAARSTWYRPRAPAGRRGSASTASPCAPAPSREAREQVLQHGILRLARGALVEAWPRARSRTPCARFQRASSSIAPRSSISSLPLQYGHNPYGNAKPSATLWHSVQRQRSSMPAQQMYDSSPSSGRWQRGQMFIA